MRRARQLKRRFDCQVQVLSPSIVYTINKTQAKSNTEMPLLWQKEN